jgi:DNA mismatch repair protein MutS
VETATQPEFFSDLHLDKIVAAITLGKDDYNLYPFFSRPIRDLRTIAYRHEVMRDLEHEDNLQMIRSFARSMRAIREHLAQSDKLHYAHQKKLWFLDAVEIYCAAVDALAKDFDAAALRARGLLTKQSPVK